MKPKEVEVILKEMGFSITSQFVPWKQSRNSKEKYPSLNWKVTLLKNGKKILTTDYMAGCAHCPSYLQRETYDSRKAVLLECETGFKSKLTYSLGHFVSDKKFPILPSISDFMHSIILDSDALQYDFEDWCANFGYEEDSRKAEKIFNECLEIGLKLNRAVSSEEFEKLQEIFQDY